MRCSLNSAPQKPFIDSLQVTWFATRQVWHTISKWMYWWSALSRPSRWWSRNSCPQMISRMLGMSHSNSYSAYNTAVQESLGESPFFLMHGYDPGELSTNMIGPALAAPPLWASWVMTSCCSGRRLWTTWLEHRSSKNIIIMHGSALPTSVWGRLWWSRTCAPNVV